MRDAGDMVDMVNEVAAGEVVAGAAGVKKLVVLGKVAVSKRFLTTVIMRYCERPASRAGIRLVLNREQH